MAQQVICKFSQRLKTQRLKKKKHHFFVRLNDRIEKKKLLLLKNALQSISKVAIDMFEETKSN